MFVRTGRFGRGKGGGGEGGGEELEKGKGLKEKDELNGFLPPQE